MISIAGAGKEHFHDGALPCIGLVSSSELKKTSCDAV
jgi:hypothetical protein